MGFKTERPFSFGRIPAIVAHRGASHSHPENTLPAFAAALELGVELIELDVRLTKDGVPVVIHDADVSRTTDGVGVVHELTIEQVTALDASHGRGERFRVPTLRRVLEAVASRAGVVIEIKNLPGDPGFVPDGEPHVEAAFDELSQVGFEDPAIVCSFNPSAIRRAAELAADRGLPVATGLLTGPMIPVEDAIGVAADGGHGFVLPHREAVRAAGIGVVAAAHDARVRLGTWTVDDPAELRTLIGWGLDALATNDPATALAVREQVLAEHGAGEVRG